MSVEVIEPYDSSLFVTAVMDGHFFEAKVYYVPSEKCGIGGGRVHKLIVLPTARPVSGVTPLEQACYAYDRELLEDHAPAGLVDKVVRWCEELPVPERPPGA